jgi:hypothetical protein
LHPSRVPRSQNRSYRRASVGIMELGLGTAALIGRPLSSLNATKGSSAWREEADRHAR